MAYFWHVNETFWRYCKTTFSICILAHPSTVHHPQIKSPTHLTTTHTPLPLPSAAITSMPTPFNGSKALWRNEPELCPDLRHYVPWMNAGCNIPNFIKLK